MKQINPLLLATMHAYFPELSSLEWARDSFDGVRFSPPLGAPAGFSTQGGILEPDSYTTNFTARFLSNSKICLQSDIRCRGKALRLVEGRLQVVGFNCDFSLAKKPGKRHASKRKIVWREVLHYLMR
jgi:hypothetical protein